MQWFFPLFLLVELWTLIELGSATSPLYAVAWVVLSIVIGMSLIRRRGLSMIRQMQRDAETGLVTPRLLSDDLAVVTSGLLLILPGLVTDCLAVVVLIGPLRRALARILPVKTRSSVHVHVTTGSRRRDGNSGDEHVTLEGDYRRVDD